jgi:hypothetical protein
MAIAPLVTASLMSARRAVSSPPSDYEEGHDIEVDCLSQFDGEHGVKVNLP